MNELNTDQRLAIADEAKRLLNDPLFNGVIKTLVKGYMEQLVATRPGSPEGVVAHACLSAMDDIKKQLRALENDGAVVRKSLKQKPQA
jgi:hypothetical protein